MNFPLIRHKDFKAWIPSTDVDEIDAPEGVLTEALNVDFRNGYIENSQNAVAVAHPTDIQTDITAGYELLSMKGFTHSDKGDTTVYILYKYTTEHLVKIWLTGGGETAPKLMNIGEDTATVWMDKPRDINYNLVNEQLKINLNCQIMCLGILIEYNREVMANLTLLYLDEIVYEPNILTRTAGWYLFPRWLGWNFTQSKISTIDMVDSFLDFETSTNYGLNNGETGFLDILGGGGVRVVGTPGEPAYQGIWMLRVQTDMTTKKWISITNIQYPAEIEFFFNQGNFGGGAEAPLVIEIMDTANEQIIHSEEINGISGGWGIYRYKFDKFYSQTSFIIRIPMTSSTTSSRCWFDCIKIKYNVEAPDIVVVAKYFDGQRALLPVMSTNKINKNSVLRIYGREIDWRIDFYEIYIDYDGIFYLSQIVNRDDGWILYSSYPSAIQKPISLERTSDSLPFKYGLPADTRVDTQRHIYMEVEHKGRIFFIKDDYKVYQSHISANMAIQADAFPYDEEVGFGYFITAHNRINRGIAITPTNYLAIFTDSGFYVYFIQPSSTGSFKTLRLSSGSIGLSSRDSITRSLTGDPATDGLFWVDDNGIYFYTGDSQPPKNLILPTHEKYWREEVSPVAKANTVGFYNPLKREYWLKVGNDGIGETVSNDYTIVYELPYDNWKRQRFPNLGLDEFYGVFNNVLYYRSGNQFVKFDISTKSIFVIETPYETGQMGSESTMRNIPIPEIYDKILQEVYMVFENENNGTTDVYMETIIDGKSIGTLTFNPKLPFEKWLTPLGIRFNRIKFKISNSETGHITRIKEFGCSYSLDTKEPLGQQMVDDQPNTYGYGRSYGRAYGRN